jgi:hypothetical protein
MVMEECDENILACFVVKAKAYVDSLYNHLMFIAGILVPVLCN